MPEPMESLEKQVERELARLAPRIDVAWPAESRAQVRAAIHAELAEGYWRQSRTPQPSEALLVRIRAAMRRELAAGRTGYPHRRRMSRWRAPARLAGLAAAAAVFALVITRVYWPAGEESPASPQIAPPSFADSSAADIIEEFAVAASQIWTRETADTIADPDTENWVEGGSASIRGYDGWEQMIEEMHRRLDDLFSDPVSDVRAAGAGVRS